MMFPISGPVWRFLEMPEGLEESAEGFQEAGWVA